MSKILKLRAFIWLCNLLLFSTLHWSCKNNPAEPDEPTATSLSIEADAFVIYSGGTLQFKAILTSSDGSTTDATRDAVWSNSPALVGTVDENGLFTAVNNVIGTESIRIEYRGEAAAADVEVERRAAWLGVSPVIVNVEGGDELQFRAVVSYQDGSQALVTDKVEWSVSPGLAASIDENGLLHTISGASGIEIVKANYHGTSTESEVEVQAQYQSRFEMVEIPAGTFIMGDDNGLADEKPAHEVFISTFEIGRYEVTNAEYARYLTEAFVRGEVRHENGFITKGKPPFLFIGTAKVSGPEYDQDFIVFIPGDSEGEGSFAAVPGFENYPVGRVHWYGALSFCDFYGVRFPTEAEWEKACRGGMQFDYGTEDGSIGGDLANLAGTQGADIFEAAAPVGSFPANPYGLFDMAGNVSEFVFDLYDAEYYQNSPTVDPFGPGPVTLHLRNSNLIWIIRGGYWTSLPQDARAARRELIDEPHINAGVFPWSGFRVARSVP